MTILQKGPCTRKEYKEYRDELWDQIDDLRSDIENREFLSVAFLIPAAICFMPLLMAGLSILCNASGVTLSPSTTSTNSITILITIMIINIACVGTYYLLYVKPYKNQLKRLKNDKAELVNYYHDNLVDVPLDDYIEHISVVGDTVTFPSLDAISEYYVYKRHNNCPAEACHNTAQTHQLHTDKLKNSIYTIPITQDEYKKLRQKSKCAPRSTKQTTVTNKRLVKMANTTEVTIEHSVTTKDGTRTETYEYTIKPYATEK